MDRPVIDPEADVPVPINLPPDAVQRRLTSVGINRDADGQEFPTITKAAVRTKYRKGLAANRFLRLLKVIEAAKAAHARCKMQQDVPRISREFEDPFLRLQRKMCHENKKHFLIIQSLFLGLWHRKFLLDVELKCLEGIVPIHLPLLSAHSDVWTDFCYQRGCSLYKHSPILIDFGSAVTLLGLRNVVNYLYVGRIKVGYSNCVEIFDAARALRLHYLAKMAEAFANVLLQEHNLWSTVSATRSTACALFDIAWTKLATMFVELSKTRDFLEMDAEDLLWFLKQNELKVTSEYEVFEAAINWMKHDRLARLPHFQTIMGCIRFALMSTDELVMCMKSDLVFQEPIGMEMLSFANLARLYASQNQNWSDYELPKTRMNPVRMEKHYEMLGCQINL
ncbi:kelch-like protein 7 isoform X2 [Paramacrobiotus metropolitanus]|nr:kelch-like protein 7 isoform X2 [Paramacrobiotus metropolitanus]